MNKLLSIVILLCTIQIVATAQKKNCTISGYVKEKKSKELLIGVNIYIPGTQIGTTSNTYGFYSITIPAGNQTLTYSYVGFNPQTKTFNLKTDTLISVELENVVELSGVEINAERKISDDIQMSVVSVPVKQIKEIPAFLGEKDVFKVLQLMPGVRSGSEGSSGLYVRGGGPDQNLIILDDATVYNANHLFGFFSVFNGDAIKSVELIKGGFPARYGGRLSSVVDINMKDGNKEKVGGECGVGLISSRLLLEGPIVKGKSSFLISGRRTYIDVLSQPIIMAYNDGNPAGYYFYDLNAKLNYDFGDKNKLFLSGYFGRDKAYMNFNDGFETDSKFNLYWQNQTATARWNHVFTNKIFANTSFIYSKYLFKIFEEYNDGLDTYSLDYHSGIEDISLKYDISYIPVPNHYIRVGAIVTSHTFTPSAVVYKDSYSGVDENDITKIYSVESGFYAEDEFKIKARTKINAGFRLSSFNHKEKNYFHFEPRILASYMIRENLSMKASYTEMNQYMHLLSNTGISLPIDLWVPATRNIGPQNSKQIAFGFAKDFEKPRFSISTELYYKKMSNIISYKEGASFLMLEDPTESSEFNYENSVTSGTGYSTGFEMLIQKKYGKWTGWIGYTLSYTKYHFDALNNGKEFFPRHDRRHDISVVSIYEISKNITLSATWVYGTGDAVSLPLSTYATNPHSESFLDNLKGGQFYYNYASKYGEKNSFRYAPYHRMDIGVQFKKDFKSYTRIWEFSIYNVYNRHNPYMYFTETYYSGGKYVTKLKQISLFPIIPSFSYNVKF